MKTLEYYIEKYGEESGTKRYQGVLKAEQSKSAKYALQPYKRLSLDWYKWRYGEEKGSEKFHSFVNKCAHRLGVFVEKYGLDEGTKRYNETIAKKNTKKIIIESKGIEEYNRILQKHSHSMMNRTPEQREETKKKRIATFEKKKNLPKKTRLEMFVEKYGEELGEQEYLIYKQKIYSGPSRMSGRALHVYDMIFKKHPSIANELYCDMPGRKEFFLLDDKTLRFYDFTHRETKVILEFYGDFWHPVSRLEDIHPVTKISLTEMYDKDRNKENLATFNGFDLFIIRDSFNEEEVERIVETFIERIKSKL